MSKRSVFPIKILFIIIFSIALILLALPHVIKLAAVNWLENQNMTAAIGKIDIDYDDLKITIENAKAHNNNSKGFDLGKFYLDLQWKGLFDNKIIVEAIEINGFNIDIEESQRKLSSVAGINLSASNPEQVDKEPENVDSKPWRIEINSIHFGNIKSCYEQVDYEKRFCVSLGELSFPDKLVFDMGESIEKQLQVESSLILGAFEIIEEKGNLDLVNFKKLSFNNILMKEMNDISLGQISLENFTFFPGGSNKNKAEDVLKLEQFDIQKIKLLNQNELSIEEINLTGFGVDLEKDKQGKLLVASKIAELQPKEQKKSVKTDKPKEEPGEFAIKINALNVLNSRNISYRDNSLNTPFVVSSKIKEFRLDNIDTSNKDQTSHLLLHVLTDKHGIIEIDGDIKLLSSGNDLNLKGKITGVDLRPISSYLEANLGHRVKSGQLNADLNIKSVKGDFDTVLKLDLKHFELKALTSQEKEKLDKEMGLGMPLDTALNLLRESDNSIQLEIPITGQAEKLEVDPSDIIYTATSKAITSAVINYYTPFGLVAVAGGLFDLATALRFEPIIFESGKNELLKIDKEGLDKISTLMKERPKLHVTLCGFANKSDMDVLAIELKPNKEKPNETSLQDKDKNKLLNLASKRGEHIKAILIENKIPADRLILCEPEFDLDAISGVEISI